jgi:RimJ/RimL family protein N-acetyltransferase
VGVFNGVELDDLVLSGPRLTLRRWELRDAGPVYAIFADGSMNRYLGVPEVYTPEMAGQFVVALGHEGRGEGTGFGCAVELTETGELVASASLRLPTAGRRHGEIGYWVAPAAQGHGYAAEVTDVLCRWAFEHGVHRIELFCEPTNLASAASAMRAGFRFEGFQRNATLVRGEWRDTAAFARLAGDSGEPTPWSFPKLAEPLTDGVVALRPYTEGDTAATLEIENDAVTIGVGFTGKPVTEDDLVRRTASLPLKWLVGGPAQFVIEDVATRHPAGTIQLRNEGPPKVASIGYDMHPSFRGRRYTTRALRLLSSWAFSIGYERLELGAKWHNLASQRSAEGAGFIFESDRPARLPNPDGAYSDETSYYLLNPTTRRSASEPD